VSSTPEIAEREEALRQMLEGESDSASADEARAGVEAARRDRERDDAAGILSPRELGFGLIKAGRLHGGGDWQELFFAVTDGEREAAIVVRLNGSLVASLAARDEELADEQPCTRLRARRAPGYVLSPCLRRDRLGGSRPGDRLGARTGRARSRRLPTRHPGAD
jgi:hypothetical protein